MRIGLSRNAEKLIEILYARYLDQLQNGKSKFDSANFGGSEDIYNTISTEWTQKDLDKILRELEKNGLVENLYSDDSVEHCMLTANGIIRAKGMSKKI